MKILFMNLMVTTNQTCIIDMLGFPFFCTSLKKAKNGKRAREGTENYKNNHITSNKMVISTCQTIITLNVNELNAPIKSVGSE